MAFGFTSLTLAGNVVRDPQVSSYDKGTLTKLCVAVNDSTGDSTIYMNCVAWGKTAETVGKYLKKGDKVVLCGRLKADNWVDNKGNKRTELVLTISTFATCEGSAGRHGVAPDGESRFSVGPGSAPSPNAFRKNKQQDTSVDEALADMESNSPPF